uniref:Uncharacterized protein n=1 Tax=Cannabis sativa TaxID=3483 RepID=A0A803QDK2_CANSA
MKEGHSSSPWDNERRTLVFAPNALSLCPLRCSTVSSSPQMPSVSVPFVSHGSISSLFTALWTLFFLFILLQLRSLAQNATTDLSKVDEEEGGVAELVPPYSVGLLGDVKIQEPDGNPPSSDVGLDNQAPEEMNLGGSGYASNVSFDGFNIQEIFQNPFGSSKGPSHPSYGPNDFAWSQSQMNKCLSGYNWYLGLSVAMRSQHAEASVDATQFGPLGRVVFLTLLNETFALCSLFCDIGRVSLGIARWPCITVVSRFYFRGVLAL